METLRIAAGALRTNKLRSFLTLLGVIIGVMTVVTVVSIISGLNNYISERVFNVRPDVFMITRMGIITSREAAIEAMKRKPITWADYQMIRRNCINCASVGVQHRRRGVIKRAAERAEDIRIIGSTANVTEISSLDLEAGRFFTDREEHHSTLSVVIGADVRDALFGKLDPIGRTIRVEKQPMRVIGLLRRQGTVLGEKQDDVVYIPVSTWRKQFGARDSMNIAVRARGGVPGMERAMDEVRLMLRAKRQTGFRADDPFGYITDEVLQKMWRSITAGMFAVMIFISSISLIVGGIVIMNIMLVSVVERTREIGVRRALGATRQNIRRQFLTEAVLLSFGGGVAGVFLGFVIAAIIAAVTPLPTLVLPQTVFAGLAVAVLTGVLAGLIPAVRAARLPPIDALRFE